MGVCATHHMMTYCYLIKVYSIIYTSATCLAPLQHSTGLYAYMSKYRPAHRHIHKQTETSIRAILVVNARRHLAPPK